MKLKKCRTQVLLRVTNHRNSESKDRYWDTEDGTILDEGQAAEL